MKPDLSLPFNPGDRVQSRLTGIFGTVLAIEPNANLGGWNVTVRADHGSQVAGYASFFQPIPHRRDLVRLCHVNETLPRAPCEAGRLRAASDPVSPPVAGSMTLPAPFKLLSDCLDEVFRERVP